MQEIESSATRPTRKALLDQDYIVPVKWREYTCPHCGGALVGYGCRPQSRHADFDRYLAPYLVEKARLDHEGTPLVFRSLSRFNLFICSHCYLLIDTPVNLQDGVVAPEPALASFYKRTEGRLNKDEGGARFDELFWTCIGRAAPRLVRVDWFSLAVNALLFKPRACEVFQGKGAQFNALVRAALAEPDLASRLALVRKLDILLSGGLAALLLQDSFRRPPLLFALYEYRLVQLGVMMGRESHKLFRVDLARDLLADVAELLLGFALENRPVDRSVTGMLMLLAGRMARFSPGARELRLVRMIAFLCTELLLRTGLIRYDTDAFNPDLPHENNEAIRFLNLVLRRDLGIEEVVFHQPAEKLRRDMVYGLNRCYTYGMGAGTFLQRRACRMGERITRMVARHLPEGSLELFRTKGNGGKG